MKREESEMVDRHPDSDVLRAFREHRLSGTAVPEVARHLGRCAQCAVAEPGAGDAVLRALARVDDHLSDADLDLLIDEQVHDPSYRRIANHAEACAMCRAEVEDLRRFDRVQPASRRWLIAASVAFAVLALSTIALFLFRTTPHQTPLVVSKPPIVKPAQPAVVASLADGAGRIALLADGTIAGATPQSKRDAEDARAVLSGRAISIPTFIAAMPGAVRGGGTSAHPLRALGPFRSAVLESRPTFRWTAVPNARSYRVAVFDADYEEIARSEPLKETSWTPSKPLPSGVDLSWHVVADTADGEMSSAGSDRAEAVFRVLTPKEAAEVEAGAAQYRGSHLFLGLLYGREGLLHDAEREFRSLAEQNPDSPVARRLLASVSR